MPDDSEEHEIEVDEGNIRSVEHIAPAYDTLVLRNLSGVQVDERELASALASVPGIERVKSLVVKASSMVENLIFLEALPGLETLQLNGLKLVTLDGLEWFRQGRFIKIDTGKNRKRDITRVAETNIIRLSLHYANPTDLDGIGRSSTIRELLLSNCPNLVLEQWGTVPLDTMSLFDGGIDMLANTAHVTRLRKVTFFGCKNLARFAGDNGNVTWMVLQRCNVLDVRSINTFRNLEYLVVVSVKPHLLLSAFTGLERLRSLSIQQCRVQFDTPYLKSTMPSLEKLVITSLRRKALIELSAANDGLEVTDGVSSYRGGRPAI